MFSEEGPGFMTLITLKTPKRKEILASCLDQLEVAVTPKIATENDFVSSIQKNVASKVNEFQKCHLFQLEGISRLSKIYFTDPALNKKVTTPSAVLFIFIYDKKF